ncbi:MAG: hypothetical protein P8L75_00180 [Gammaproteobacteria bacterium]|nr:hypothetical protein [Gammaproteobacteria bacterium]
MKKLFTIIFIGLILEGCNDNSIEEASTSKQPNCDEVDGIEVYENEYGDIDYTELPNEYSGKTKICVDGKVIMLTPFIDGKQNGLGKGWYKNGQLKGEVNYKDGLSEGLMRGWNEKGQLVIEWNMKEDLPEGLCKSWYDNGKLSWKAKFENGELVNQECWDEDGNDLDCP